MTLILRRVDFFHSGGRGDGREVLRDLPHPGLLPAIQETQGTGNEGRRQGLSQYCDPSGEFFEDR